MKMQSLGNDFVVLDGVSAPLRLGPAGARRIADRRAGVGCDQVLMLEPAAGSADFRYRIWNADGSEVEQCGNGARCALHFARRFGLCEKGRSSLRLETSAGELLVQDGNDDRIRAHLGVPSFERPDANEHTPEDSLFISMGEDDFICRTVRIGNPHAVIVAEGMSVERHREYPLMLLSAGVRGLPAFPDGANVGLCRPHPGCTGADLRVDERGVGETPACGSGAAAAACVLVRTHGWDSPLRIRLAGGDLLAGWDGPGRQAWVEGYVREVYSGEIRPELLG